MKYFLTIITGIFCLNFCCLAQVTVGQFNKALQEANYTAERKHLESRLNEGYSKAKEVFQRGMRQIAGGAGSSRNTQNPYAYKITIGGKAKVYYFRSDYEAQQFVSQSKQVEERAIAALNEPFGENSSSTDWINTLDSRYSYLKTAYKKRVSEFKVKPGFQKIRNSYYRDPVGEESDRTFRKGKSVSYMSHRDEILGLYSGTVSTGNQQTEDVPTEQAMQNDKLLSSISMSSPKQFGENFSGVAKSGRRVAVEGLDPNAVMTPTTDYEKIFDEHYRVEELLDRIENILGYRPNINDGESMKSLHETYSKYSFLANLAKNAYHELDDVESTHNLVEAGYKIMSSPVNPGPINDIIHSYCSDNQTGFKADVYYNEAERKWAIAYGGTDFPSQDMMSWIPGAVDYNESQNKMSRDFTDDVLTQIILTEYPDYAIASEQEQVVMKQDVLSRVSFTGHSLGGRLAVMNGIIHGVETVVYNPAWVPVEMNDMIESNLDWKKNSNSFITNITAENDLLTCSQETVKNVSFQAVDTFGKTISNTASNVLTDAVLLGAAVVGSAAYVMKEGGEMFGEKAKSKLQSNPSVLSNMAGAAETIGTLKTPGAMKKVSEMRMYGKHIKMDVGTESMSEAHKIDGLSQACSYVATTIGELYKTFE